MRRRTFIAGLGGAAAWPVVARAQQIIPVVGFLHSGSPDGFAFVVRAFRDELGQNGFVDGRNLAIEYRWAEDQFDRLPAQAIDLVSRQVSVIFASGSILPVKAAKAATTTTPIVFTVAADVLKAGLVPSLSHPGGNVTGITMLSDVLGAKRLEALRALASSVIEIAVLVDPNGPTSVSEASDVREAAKSLGLGLRVLEATTENAIDVAFAELAPAGALVVTTDPLFTSNRQHLVDLAARYRVPTIYPFREFAKVGGLLSYGASIAGVTRRAAVFVGLILKGTKPAELPVEQATEFELVINLKAAKALSLDIPATLLARADEVIE